MPNYLEYQKSISKELLSIKDRLRNFIDDHHWPEDGRYKEIILTDILRKHLPKSVSVGTGFVMGEQGLSTQVDIIIYRNDFPVMFRQSDFVIVVPEAVLGIIEVKSRITGATQLTQVVDKLSVAAEIVCKPIFSGIFSFEGYDGILNHLCIGENCFIKYWPEYAPTRENTRSRYSFYKIDDLAFGYFISNLVEDVYIATVGTNLPETLTSMFYPIENTKEAYKLTEVSMEM